MLNMIAVLGSGLMGMGIAEVSAQAGLNVNIIDISETQFEKSRVTIKNGLESMIERGKFTREFADAVISRISYSTDYTTLKNCNLIIEAVSENIEIKKQSYSMVAKFADKEAVLVSNTSVISINLLSSFTDRPDRFMGMHFFYPVPKMKLIELIRGISTSNETYTFSRSFAESLKKVLVDAPDTPGFIVNRLLNTMMNEAANMVLEGVKPLDIDNAMKFGCNFPMGPLELGDYGGLDTLLNCVTAINKGFSNNKYAPSPMLKKMVNAGKIGRKVGVGFYTYPQT